MHASVRARAHTGLAAVDPAAHRVKREVGCRGRFVGLPLPSQYMQLWARCTTSGSQCKQARARARERHVCVCVDMLSRQEVCRVFGACVCVRRTQAARPECRERLTHKCLAVGVWGLGIQRLPCPSMCRGDIARGAQPQARGHAHIRTARQVTADQHQEQGHSSDSRTPPPHET
jgi:hypothetical protein